MAVSSPTTTRKSKTKTKEQLARREQNIILAQQRLRELQAQQRRENAGRANRELVLERAQQVPNFTTWLRVNQLQATPGSAALFFARHPFLHPTGLLAVCPINAACDCLRAVPTA